jgi:hypothetical protein
MNKLIFKGKISVSNLKQKYVKLEPKSLPVHTIIKVRPSPAHCIWRTIPVLHRRNLYVWLLYYSGVINGSLNSKCC